MQVKDKLKGKWKRKEVFFYFSRHLSYLMYLDKHNIFIPVLKILETFSDSDK